jgi:L-alanine-DL-glutamate epimerase-like enolase superfamily enzyme
MRATVRIGGGSITQVLSDQGLVGIGPGTDPASLARAKALLTGKDPFHIEQFAPKLGSGRGAAAVEIALWDLIGKLANEPLYKLWGGAKDRVMPYCSFFIRGTVDERAELALRMKNEGWKAVKLRASFPTMKEDIRLVEAVRKSVGDDFAILCDGNKAYAGNLYPWEFRRAAETARAYQQLGVYWLEEPLPQFQIKEIAELNRILDMPLAGAEGSTNLHEFVEYIDTGAYDVLNPEVMTLGPSMVLKIHTLAEARGVQIVPHEGGGELGTVCQIHLVAALQNSPIAEIINEPPIRDYRNAFGIFEQPLAVGKDGYIDMPQDAGLGMTVKPELLSN